MARMQHDLLTRFGRLTAFGVALSSCVPFGEGVISVRGELREADSGELISNCTSTLLGPSGNVWEASTALDAQFQRWFTVAPSSATYTLVIACPRFKTQSVSVSRTTANEGALVEQDLGAILLVAASQ